MLGKRRRDTAARGLRDCRLRQRKISHGKREYRENGRENGGWEREADDSEPSRVAVNRRRWVLKTELQWRGRERKEEGRIYLGRQGEGGAKTNTRSGGIVAKEFLIRLEIEINSRQKFEYSSMATMTIVFPFLPLVFFVFRRWMLDRPRGTKDRFPRPWNVAYGIHDE